MELLLLIVALWIFLLYACYIIIGYNHEVRKLKQLNTDLTMLTQEDKAVIENLNKRLKRLEDIYLSKEPTPSKIDEQSTAQQEPINESKGERWQVEVYQLNITGDEGFQLNIKPLFKLKKPLADQAAFAIKELLKTL
jgi:hypothetical protein